MNDDELADPVNVNPRIDWRRWIYQLVHIWFNEDTDLFTNRGQKAILGLEKPGANVSTATAAAEPSRFDRAVLAMAALGLACVALNLLVLVKMVVRGRGDAITNVFVASSLATAVYLSCIVSYEHVRTYESRFLNWLATVSLTYVNWSYPIMLMCALAQACPRSCLHRASSVPTARLTLVILFLLANLPAIPGYLEARVYADPTCTAGKSTPSCVGRFKAAINLQLTLVPVVTLLLPFLATIALLIVTLRRYRPKGVQADDGGSRFSDTAVQALGSGLWFIIYYCPDVLLLGLIGGRDGSRADYHTDFSQLKGARGIIKMALCFRLLNASANFFVNLLCGRRFQYEFLTALCCRWRDAGRRVERRESADAPQDVIIANKSRRGSVSF